MITALAGPQVGYLFWVKRDSSFTNELIDLKDEFKNGDFGLTFGAEYKVAPHLFLRAGGIYGIYQVAQDDENFEMRNHYLSFRIGYAF